MCFYGGVFTSTSHTHTFPLLVSFFTFVCAPSVAFLGHVILSVIISLDVNRVWVNEDDQIKID